MRDGSSVTMDVGEQGGQRKRADRSKPDQNLRLFSLPWRRRGQQKGIGAETADSAVQQQGSHLQLTGMVSGNGGSRRQHKLQCIGRRREDVRSSQMESVMELKPKLVRGERSRPSAVAGCYCRGCFALELDFTDGKIGGRVVVDRQQVDLDVDGDTGGGEEHALSCISRVCQARSVYIPGEMEVLEQQVLDMDCRRCLFLTYLGAAGLRLVQPSAYWPVFELLLVSLMPVHPHRHTRGAIPRWRLWSHVALKIGVAVSTRFCCPLLGPFLTAHALLSLRDLRVNHDCRMLLECQRRSKDGLRQLCSAALEYSALKSKEAAEWQALEAPSEDAGALSKACENDNRYPPKCTLASPAIEVQCILYPEERDSALLPLGSDRSQSNKEGSQEADSRMIVEQGLYPQASNESQTGDPVLAAIERPACILPPTIKTLRMSVQEVDCGDISVENSNLRSDGSVESPTSDVFYDALTCVDCALLENHEEDFFKDRLVGQELSKSAAMEDLSFHKSSPMDVVANHSVSFQKESGPCSLQSNPSICAMSSAGGVALMVPPFRVERLSVTQDIKSAAVETMNRSELDYIDVGLLATESSSGQTSSCTEFAASIQPPGSGCWSDDRLSDSASTGVLLDEDGDDVGRHGGLENIKSSADIQDPGEPFGSLDHGLSTSVKCNLEFLSERHKRLADDADLLVQNPQYSSDSFEVRTKPTGAQYLKNGIEDGLSGGGATCATLPVSSIDKVEVQNSNFDGTDCASSEPYQAQQPGADTESLTSSSSSSSFGFTDSEDELLNLLTVVPHRQDPTVPGSENSAPTGQSKEEVWTSTVGSEQTVHVVDDQGLPFAAGTIATQSIPVENCDVPGRILQKGVRAAQINDERIGEGDVAYSHGNHPLCVAIRSRRHSHGDQNYWSVSDLAAAPWRDLVFWHGRCRKGRPTLCVLLGKAVCTLSSTLLGSLVTVIVSNMELAELNLFNGSVEQMNLVIDLSGLGLLRMPPMDILQRLGTILNRDYAGRGGSVYVLNAPVMLSLVVAAIKGVILRPSYNKGAMIEKGFLESKESISVLGRRFLQVLQKHFEMHMIHAQFGGQCNCSKQAKHCSVGYEFLAQREAY